MAEGPRQDGAGFARVLAGLGSNSPDAPVMLARAREALAALPGLKLAACSPVYRTEPQDYADQPWFSNQVLALEARGWAPVPLMEAFLAAETALGRVRSRDPALRFGPRRIDIDMLLFGEKILDHPVCTLPHPRLTRRAFWLVPLRDIVPDLRIAGESLDRHLARLSWSCRGRVIRQPRAPFPEET